MEFNIKLAVESLANEKGLVEDEVKEAIQIALSQATRRQHMLDADFEVRINDSMDSYETFRVWHIVDPEDVDSLQVSQPEIPGRFEEVEVAEFNPNRHLTLEEAQTRLTEATERFAKADDELTSVRSQFDSTELKNTELQKQVREAKAEANKVKRKLARNEKQDEPKQDVIDELTTEFQMLEQAHASAVQALEEHSDALEKAQVQLSRTQRSWDQVQEKKTFLKVDEFTRKPWPVATEVQIGSTLLEPWKSVEWGRREAQQAKGIITQMVRQAERKRIEDEYANSVGQLIRGTVTRMGRDAIILDVKGGPERGGAEAVLPRSKMLPREILHVGTQVRAILEEVDPNNRGPQLILNRTGEDMLKELMRTEIPEVQEGTIEVVKLVREPGIRAKVAVRSRNNRVDAVGACVGMRGSRIQNVSNEIGGENVDVAEYNADPLQMVVNAMRPAPIEDVLIDEGNQSMDVIVKEDKYGTASGRDGINIRLVGRLTGWNLNLMTQVEYEEKRSTEVEVATKRFSMALGVDEELAKFLAEQNFTTVEELAFTTDQEYEELGFDLEAANQLQQLAREARVREVATGAAADGTAIPAADLLGMTNMKEELAYKLAASGVVTMEDLANLSIDELLDVEPQLNEDDAGEMIMTARKPWFASDDEEAGEAAPA